MSFGLIPNWCNAIATIWVYLLPQYILIFENILHYIITKILKHNEQLYKNDKFRIQSNVLFLIVTVFEAGLNILYFEIYR